MKPKSAQCAGWEKQRNRPLHTPGRWAMLCVLQLSRASKLPEEEPRFTPPQEPEMYSRKMKRGKQNLAKVGQAETCSTWAHWNGFGLMFVSFRLSLRESSRFEDQIRSFIREARSSFDEPDGNMNLISGQKWNTTSAHHTKRFWRCEFKEARDRAWKTSPDIFKKIQS